MDLNEEVPSSSLSISKPIVIEEWPEAEFDRLMNYCETSEEVQSLILDQAWQVMSACDFPKEFLNRFNKQLKRFSDKRDHYAFKKFAAS